MFVFVLASTGLFAQGYETINIKKTEVMEYGTVCIGSLLHSFVKIDKSISHIQMMEEATYSTRSLKPVRCNSNQARTTGRKSSFFKESKQ